MCAARRRACRAAGRATGRFAVTARGDWYNRGLAAVAPHHGDASRLSGRSGPAMMHAHVVPELSVRIEEIP
ncbi:hypothetical protein DF156_20225 [Burkholderia ubonensis]|nr:hypothetical protein CJO70_13050 [Burkholderia ubonensis]PAJ94222.1 hypothetical protein CJO69_13665 [Burkholderia ubonensis]PAK09032.1 hypothetical protein CJO67_04975 [Burkholderia ubonensis]RQP31687.1 hypothetical protein DF155_19935 [Burkholderia ubonensis]RQP34629.1 hypothetical protein DF154_23605 [Burkholderia ubonensis]